MTSSSSSADQRLVVLALGGNALSPPSGDSTYQAEREIIHRTGEELSVLSANADYRLLIVHGNGPQVGRLMREDVVGANLDIYVAQTQGELGYLLVKALAAAGLDNCVSIVTRCEVSETDPGLVEPTKAVGPVLPNPPDGPARQTQSGWRLLVGSPRPRAVLELPAIRTLLETQHVVAGGGGGIPVSAAGKPVAGVVDKDWVAALLANQLDADELVFVTDVAGVYEAFGSSQQRLLPSLDLDAAASLARNGAFGAGSMAPKVDSAASYTRNTGRTSYITALGTIDAALAGTAGTRITL